MNKIGIMQGRLSPIINNKIQAFPFNNWQNEFKLASRIGYELIEWIIDENILDNPIFNKEKTTEINDLKKKFLVDVNHICLDFLMTNYLINKENSYIFEKIFNEVSHEYKIEYVELPLLGKFSLSNRNFYFEYIEFILNIVKKKPKENMTNLIIETDLNPIKIIEFLKNFDQNSVLINYDTGNSAYWGYNETEEIMAYGHKIGNIHMKDCTKKDYTVPLGKGEVNFKKIFQLLKKIKYHNDFIVQAARSGKDFKDCQNYYFFLKNYIDEFIN